MLVFDCIWRVIEEYLNKLNVRAFSLYFSWFWSVVEENKRALPCFYAMTILCYDYSML